MPSQSDYSNAFWLGYCDAIKESWLPSSGKAMFFPQQGQLGPAAGSGIDERFTNYGIYQLADNLLRDDSLSYSPSESNSYSRELLKFVDNVDLGSSNAGAGAEARLDERRRDLDPAQDALGSMKAKALRRYEQEVDMGIAEPGSFERWAMMNAPELSVALMQDRSRGAAFTQAQQEVHGANSNKYNEVRNKLEQAINSEQHGVSMQVAIQTPSAAVATREAQLNGQSPPGLQGTRYVPVYSISDYNKVVADSLSAFKAGKRDEEKVTIDYNKGKSVNQSGFGQSSLGGNPSFEAPWFSITANGNTSSVLRNDDQQKTSVDIRWTDRRLINVNPGDWDIENSDYRLKSGAPDTLKLLMRPDRLVCLSNLAYDIKFSGESIQEVDQAIFQASREGGTIRVFGWSVEFGDGQKRSEASHIIEWNKPEGTLKVTPQLRGLSINVAAIVGEKVNARG